MEKIQLRPVFKFFAHLSKSLGWLPFEKARNLDLMMACATADIVRIIAINNKHPNGLSEAQKIQLFETAGENLSWVERYNRDEEFQKNSKSNLQQMTGSNETGEEIERKHFAFFQKLYEHNLFPQTFEGQRTAVEALDTLNFNIKSAGLRFLLSEEDWNQETLHWLADHALLSCESFNRLQANPTSNLHQKIVDCSRFTPELTALFFKQQLLFINWERLESPKGESDIAPKSPLWQLALKHLPEPLVMDLIEAFPGLTQKLRFTTVLSERKTISVEMFERIASQERMNVKRLARKSRDPEGIVQAAKNGHVQSYFKQYVNTDPYTKQLLEYLVHKETQETRATILQALESRDETPVATSKRKM